MGEDVLEEMVDRNGARVVLLERVWKEKILRDHPEIRCYQMDVIHTVVSPDHHEPDVQPNRTRYFARNRGPSRWLMVAVSYEQAPARIVTAFGRRKDPPLWKSST